MKEEVKIDAEKVTPIPGKLLVAIKAWPAQSESGIFMPESHTIIRGELYVTEVIKSNIIGNEYKRGDIIIVSMYSGQHINSEGVKAKIISEGDILMFKTKENMDKDKSFEPKTFTPGVNYMLVREENGKEVKTKGGIIISKGSQESALKNDYVTKVSEVIKKGKEKKIEGMNISSYFGAIDINDTIITDTFVGIPMNQGNITPKYTYNIMYIFDAIALLEDVV